MSNERDLLHVTLEQLALMHRALADLRAERHRYSPEWFGVVTEGPLDEIRRLEAEVDRLTGRVELVASR